MNNQWSMIRGGYGSAPVAKDQEFDVKLNRMMDMYFRNNLQFWTKFLHCVINEAQSSAVNVQSN